MASTTLAPFLALLQLVPTSPTLSSYPFPSSSPFESFNDWGGGDKTNPSPGRSPKQPLPGTGLYDPLYGRQAYPEFNSFHQEVGQISPREELFSCYPRPPLIVELRYCSRFRPRSRSQLIFIYVSPPPSPCAIRPCHPYYSMRLALILSRGGQ